MCECHYACIYIIQTSECRYIDHFVIHGLTHMHARKFEEKTIRQHIVKQKSFSHNEYVALKVGHNECVAPKVGHNECAAP